MLCFRLERYNINKNISKFKYNTNQEPYWQYIYKNYPDLIKDVTILKAPHHGRDNDYDDEFMPYMNA
jgi:hypothetical protein